MTDVAVTLAVEGTTDAAVVRRLLDEAGLLVGTEYVKRGKDALDQSMPGYNKAARFSCWLIVRDLDTDARCPADLRAILLPNPEAHMRLHVAVRAVEAWLMADAERVAEALSVPRSRIPAEPELLPRPKYALVDLARRSRKRTIREDLVPQAGTSAKVGPGYAAFLIEFATTRWRPAVAATRSPSLSRLRDFLRRRASRS